MSDACLTRCAHYGPCDCATKDARIRAPEAENAGLKALPRHQNFTHCRHIADCPACSWIIRLIAEFDGKDGDGAIAAALARDGGM